MESPIVKALNEEVTKLLEALDANPAARALFDGSSDLGTYVSFLTETYHYVRYTHPLLARAAERLKELDDRPHMAALYDTKAQEEFGHDKWAMDDLTALGCRYDDVHYRNPCPAVEAYIAWNQFMVESNHPTGYLGTAYILEALSTERASLAAEKMVAAGAIPNIENAVYYLRGHAEADGGHVFALGKMLSKVTDPAEIDMIVMSARVTRMTYVGMFESIAAKSLQPA